MFMTCQSDVKSSRLMKLNVNIVGLSTFLKRILKRIMTHRNIKNPLLKILSMTYKKQKNLLVNYVDLLMKSKGKILLNYFLNSPN